MKKIDWKNKDWLKIGSDFFNYASNLLFGVLLVFALVSSLHYFAVTADLQVVAYSMLNWWMWFGVAWCLSVIFKFIKHSRDKKNDPKKQLNDWFDEFVLDDCRTDAKIALKEILEVK